MWSLPNGPAIKVAPIESNRVTKVQHDMLDAHLVTGKRGEANSHQMYDLVTRVSVQSLPTTAGDRMLLRMHSGRLSQ